MWNFIVVFTKACENCILKCLGKKCSLCTVSSITNINLLHFSSIECAAMHPAILSLSLKYLQYSRAQKLLLHSHMRDIPLLNVCRMCQIDVHLNNEVNRIHVRCRTKQPMQHRNLRIQQNVCHFLMRAV